MPQQAKPPFAWAIPTATGSYIFTQDKRLAAQHAERCVNLFAEASAPLDLALINRMAEQFTAQGFPGFTPAAAKAATLAVNTFVMWLWLTQMPESKPEPITPTQ